MPFAVFLFLLVARLISSWDTLSVYLYPIYLLFRDTLFAPGLARRDRMCCDVGYVFQSPDK